LKAYGFYVFWDGDGEIIANNESMQMLGDFFTDRLKATSKVLPLVKCHTSSNGFETFELISSCRHFADRLFDIR